MHENLIRPDLVGPALARALRDSRWQRPQAALIPGGKSNLTFELTSDAGTVVLRLPPDGPLLPRAPDMGREARLQRALPVLTPAPSMLPGFPPRSYLADLCAKRTGADLSDLTAYVALAHFKFAVIAQGIAARVRAGSMAEQEFGDLDAEVERIADEGLAMLGKEN